MPFPKALVSMHGQSTKWLQAPETRLPVPPLVTKGATAPIPGSITFKIKQRADVIPGAANQDMDAFTLRGHMSKIERDIPSFQLPRNIIIQHPIQIVAEPKHLRCLAPGKQTLFMWTVPNFDRTRKLITVEKHQFKTTWSPKSFREADRSSSFHRL